MSDLFTGLRTWPAALFAAISVTMLESTALAQAPLEYSGSCTAAGCHDGYSRYRTVHQPVAGESCDVCHEPPEEGKHVFTYVAEGAELCFECHDEEDFEGEVRHSPFAEGQCLTCHDPHAGDTDHLLTSPTVGELCAECHEEVTEDLDFLHGPVAAGQCTGCHDPHAADHQAMLFAEGRDLCAKCHAPILKRITESSVSHEPVRTDCGSCHRPHGGNNRMNLSAPPPELCLDCHDDLADALDEATVGHDAVTMSGSCANCHDPHASDFERLLARESMDLCLSCHNKPLKSDAGQIANIAEKLASNPNHHGPIAQKDCVACHSPHGGENFRLLVEAFPSTFYAPYDEERYALCFSCHEEEMLEDEQTDEATGFRNGERNLHYLHVNRPIKGRTCRACHDPHASSKPKQIADSVPFGEWAIPLNFEKTQTGGSCAPGCHRPYSYDREVPVVNLAIGQPQNETGKETESGGK